MHAIGLVKFPQQIRIYKGDRWIAKGVGDLYIVFGHLVLLEVIEIAILAVTLLIAVKCCRADQLVRDHMNTITQTLELNRVPLHQLLWTMYQPVVAIGEKDKQ